MMDMIERVAEAIVSAGDNWLKEAGAYNADIIPPEILARAAIEAMREPTDEMTAACWRLFHPWGVNAPDPSERPNNFAEMVTTVTADWQAMIDEALSKP